MCKEIVYNKISTVAAAFKNNLQEITDRILSCLYNCCKKEFVKWSLITYKNYPEETIQFISDNAFTDCLLKFKETATKVGLYESDATVKTVVFNFFRNTLRENLQKENRLAAKKQQASYSQETMVLEFDNELKEKLYQSVEAALEQMELADRQIIIWRHLEDKSNEEIAKLLNISTPSATNRIYRCMQRLRNLTENSI